MSTVAVPETTVEQPVATVADVLDRAADLLEEFGWCQKKAGSKFEGEMCAVGAIMESVDDFTGSWGSVGRDLYNAACSIQGDASEATIWPLAIWNDAPGRTKAEVVARLRDAARAAR